MGEAAKGGAGSPHSVATINRAFGIATALRATDPEGHTMTANPKAKRGVAWCFFVSVFARRYLRACDTEGQAISDRKVWSDSDPSPIFRITEPRTKTKRKAKR